MFSKLKIYLVMMVNGIVLVILGLYGYLIPKGSPTALISTAVGLILFFLAFGAKRQNTFATNAGIILSLITVIVFYFVGFKRDNYIILVMALVTMHAMFVYIFDFYRKWKLKKG